MSSRIVVSFASAPNLDVRRLFASPVLEVTRYRCTVSGTAESAEQAQPAHVVSFPHRGAFEIRYGGVWAVVDPNVVLLHNAWSPYTTRHPVGGHDTGVTVALRADVAVEIARRRDPRVDDHPARPFAGASLPVPPAAVLLERTLVRYLTLSPRPDPMLVEETTLDLVDAMVAASQSRALTAARTGADATTRVGRLVEGAKTLLASRFRERVSLSDVASALRVSPYHLCRSFKRSTGSTVHRYLMRLRLREALEQVQASTRDLSALAIDLGFDSHSHFTAAFHREYGTTPRAIRGAPLNADTLRRLAAGLRDGEPRLPPR